MTAFKTQQARWAKGLIQTSKKILPRILKSDANWHEKLEAFYHLTANISYPLMIVLSRPAPACHDHPQLPGLASNATHRFPLIYRVHHVRLHLLHDVPARVIPKKWHRQILYVPFLLSLGGIGLTITNTKAVLEALFGIKSAFARTPKFAVKKKGEKSQAQKYRKRLGIIPWIELLIGSYFAFTIWYAVISENYFTIPFLILFVFGYWYTALLSIFQGRFERSGLPRGEAHEKPFPVGV